MQVYITSTALHNLMVQIKNVFFSDSNEGNVDYVVFVMFVLLLVVILMNLLNGLAVSDINLIR